MSHRSRDVIDAVVFGSGAGGAPAVYRLAAAGFRSSCSRRGRGQAAADFVHDEPLALIRVCGSVPSVADEPHVLVSERTGRMRRTALGWIACCVGGGTAHMGASLMRFHPDDLCVVSRCGPLEGCADWPYGYDELERYYSEAQWLVGVSGLAGANPLGGTRSRTAETFRERARA